MRRVMKMMSYKTLSLKWTVAAILAATVGCVAIGVLLVGKQQEEQPHIAVAKELPVSGKKIDRPEPNHDPVASVNKAVEPEPKKEPQPVVSVKKVVQSEPKKEPLDLLERVWSVQPGDA